MPVGASMIDLLSSNYKQIIKVVLFLFYCGFEGLSDLPKDHRETEGDKCAPEFQFITQWKITTATQTLFSHHPKQGMAISVFF